MKLAKLRFFILLAILYSSNIAFAQINQEVISSYKQYLQDNQNMTSKQLLEMHPAGLFTEDLNLNTGQALFFDSIAVKYALTDYEKDLINQNGFMVTERLSYPDFGHALGDIWKKDLPVFVSTDAILHAIHMSYDNILKTIEVSYLIPKLEELLMNLKNQQAMLDSKYSSNPAMLKCLYDLDVYLTVATKLMGLTSSVYYTGKTSTDVSKILKYIEAEKPVEDSLFSSTTRMLDYSQFTVRGHYTDPYSPKLAKYFKTMMWLGRTEIYLLTPRALEPAPTKEDIQRQTILALLVREALHASNSVSLWKEIDDITKFFVGESDNVTPENLDDLVDAVGITNSSDLLDTNLVKTFQDTLKTKSYAFQRILSQIIMTGFNDPDSIIPASSFLLLGQRFIVDSYVLGNVVFDKIVYQNSRVMRMIPSTLDILFALGNDASAQLLTSELEQYHYAPNLSAMRYLIDNYENDFWNASLYNLWLNSIRKLNPPEDRQSLPLFMQTASWWQEKMNTQLSSWAQLRHDNLLYAKQSYSGGTTCSYPYSYVEPIPQFYTAVKLFASTAKNFFETKVNLGWTVYYFENVMKICDTLATIAEKELLKEQLSDVETSFLKRMLYEDSMCGIIYNGWYSKLFYTGEEIGLLKEDKVVADVHTAPTDEFGNLVGWVLHAGTGPINLGVFIAEATNTPIAYVGPVLSYYEHTTTNFKRFTDEEWKDIYNVAPSLRPSFVNLYLADNTGISKGEGSNLMTNVEKDESNKRIPQTVLLAQNYPNPFNSTTIIRFSVPASLTNQNVTLNIYDVKGQLVNRLLNENLPAGNYLTRWEGTDSKGMTVTSGIYFYNLNIGDNHISGKMSLMK